MRNKLILISMLLCSVATATAQVSIGIGLPNVSIGIDLPVYPDLVPVPGYPVYYAPRVDSNYFFYDGMYWVYQDDNWYASSWYNGPWDDVDPVDVPLFVLRIPVRYYPHPPVYFRGWRADAPPRWDQHWGHDWAQHRNGWDKWNRNAVPARPPLPVYQKKYSGANYPKAAQQQQALQSKNYRYQPHDPLVRQQHEAQIKNAPRTAQRQAPIAPPQRSAVPPAEHNAPGTPRAQPPERQSRQHENEARPAQNAPAPAQHETSPAPQERDHRPRDGQHAATPPPAEHNAPAPPAQAPQREAPPPAQQPRQHEARPQPPTQSHGPEVAPQGKEAAPEPKPKGRPGQDKDREKPDDQGGDHGPDHRK